MAGVRLDLAALLLIWGGVAVFGVPPPRTLRCLLLDERGSPSPHPALLRILGGPETPETPRDNPEFTFDVTDPLGFLKDFWGPSRCELSPTAPLPPPPGPGMSPKCPQGQRWWLLALGTPEGAGTALLRQWGRGEPRDPPRLDVSLFISTLTPNIRGLLGTPQSLHCAFAPSEGPFGLQWLHQSRGHTRHLLTFDSATSRVTGAAPGVLLFLGDRDHPPDLGDTQPPGGTLEVSLQLPSLSVPDDGSFVCSVTTPLGQVQQVLRMNVIAPPRVSLAPAALFPGVPAELRCDAVGFFPPDVEIRWERRRQEEPVELTQSSKHWEQLQEVPVELWVSSKHQEQLLEVPVELSQSSKHQEQLLEEPVELTQSSKHQEQLLEEPVELTQSSKHREQLQEEPVELTQSSKHRERLQEEPVELTRSSKHQEQLQEEPVELTRSSKHQEQLLEEPVELTWSSKHQEQLLEEPVELTWSSKHQEQLLEVPVELTWSSGHRRAADGTFSRGAGLRVTAAELGDVYSCLVTHPAWATPRRFSVAVMATPGPSVEDTAGMALVAFVIAGLCLRLWPAPVWGH
ncbi:tapasin isoform X2 [Poecile atricapillus]|uniref:tapasin isoform X2 n=1 Tax=Poecile atricapillus TaxID=48891 RepID=UPI0027386030|nr:tapasin isoform X2 [Poecile atricapillus]